MERSITKYVGLMVQFGKFGMAGMIAMATLLGLLYFFTDVLKWWYLASVVVANLGTLVVNFLIQKFFVFRNDNEEKVDTKKQFVAFFTQAGAYLVVNTALMYLWVTLCGWPYLGAQIFNVCVLAIITFYISRTYIFV